MKPKVQLVKKGEMVEETTKETTEKAEKGDKLEELLGFGPTPPETEPPAALP